MSNGKDKWLDDLLLELIRTADREWNAPSSEHGPETLGRAFADVFARIDFDAKTVDPSGDNRCLSKDPDVQKEVLEFMSVALRFGAYMAARGIELTDEFFVDGRFPEKPRLLI